MHAFTARLTELMEEKNITLRQLEKEVGINHSSVSRWLAGKTLPNIDYLCKLADYFDCSADFLLGRTDE
ncbi:MAG: helix-turn-helix domain-containing protein [Clostridiales bacterium]|nr:helix-turn-helix domain-containing protein [Clostridiales bacterium]